MKIGIISLGCCKNLVDSEKMIGMLTEAGQTMVQDPQEAEVILINTCGFIEPSKQEAIDTILAMAEYKKKNCKKLIVTGCLAQRYLDDLKAEMPEVDRFIPLDDYGQLSSILSEELQIQIPMTYGKSPQVLSGKPWLAYLKIADGCDNRCAYCAIPLIRGGYRSFPIDTLVEEAKQLIAKGVKELNLIAQDTTRYGTDWDGKRHLLELLQRCNELQGVHWIRVLYMYPDEIDDELLEGMKQLDKVIPYFDIPVQYGNDRMLKLMNRRGDVACIENSIKKIRQLFEKPVLRTTMIVGFPTETEADFEDLLAFIKRCRWDRLGAFTYSKEEDTPAYEMVPEVAFELAEQRLEKLMKVQEEISQQLDEEYIGKTIEVLVENRNPLTQSYHGRCITMAPDAIDGEVIFKSDADLQLGQFVMVTIEKARHHNLYGIHHIKED